MLNGEEKKIPIRDMNKADCESKHSSRLVGFNQPFLHHRPRIVLFRNCLQTVFFYSEQKRRGLESDPQQRPVDV